jgi:hypothetical protein
VQPAGLAHASFNLSAPTPAASQYSLQSVALRRARANWQPCAGRRHSRNTHSERLAVVVLDDEAGGVCLLNVPRRWEAACLHFIRHSTPSSANTKRSDTQISSRSCSPQKEDPKQKIRTWGRSCCLTLQALWLGGPGVSGGGRGRSPARPCGHHLGTGGADSILDGAVAASHFWATSSQAIAICRRISRSRSVFALAAQPKCSSAF